MDTVRATCCLDYPQGLFRVIVCDDGGSKEVETFVEDLPYTNVFYNARKKGPIKDYKAGNLNAGLAFSKNLPWSASCSPEDEKTEPQLYHEDEEEKSPLSHVLGYSSNGSRFVAGLDADMIPEPHWRKFNVPTSEKDARVDISCSQVSHAILTRR
jgi:cellulose synthase/poly-beta-1,6-N-acetylglucosamine synthase-like glycosyltransferase